MDQSEIHRIAQYVTTRTSYSFSEVEDIVQTGILEMVSLAETSTQKFERQHLLEYICQWTIHQTKYPETMIREILECSGRWLDNLCRTIDHENPTEVSTTE